MLSWQGSELRTHCDSLCRSLSMHCTSVNMVGSEIRWQVCSCTHVVVYSFFLSFSDGPLCDFLGCFWVHPRSVIHNGIFCWTLVYISYIYIHIYMSLSSTKDILAYDASLLHLSTWIQVCVHMIVTIMFFERNCTLITKNMPPQLSV